MALLSPSRSTGELFGPTGDSVSFGFITDTHHDPIKVTDPNQGGKYFQDAAQKVAAAATAFNARRDLSFAFQNGDFIDGSADAATALIDLATIKATFNPNVPVFHNLGNHEMTQLTKAQAIAITGQPAKWYSFARGGVTFIVLDGNFTADDDTADLSVTSVSGASPYVSYIPPTQRTWLSSTIAASPYPCVILCHYPVYYTGAFSWGLTNAAAVRTILESFGTKVIGCVTGHLHDNFVVMVNGILYATLHATTAGAYPVAGYSIVTVYPGSRQMRILGSGRQTCHVAT